MPDIVKCLKDKKSRFRLLIADAYRILDFDKINQLNKIFNKRENLSQQDKNYLLNFTVKHEKLK